MTHKNGAQRLHMPIFNCSSFNVFFLQNYDKRNRCIYAITAVATARMLYEVHLDNNIGEVLHCIEEALKKCQVIF